MRWVCILSMLKPTQCTMFMHVPSLSFALVCTQMHCPHSGTPARLGLAPVSFSKGVTLPSTLVNVRFFTQMMKCSASAHSVLGSPDWCRRPCTHSTRQRLRDSMTLLCCSVL